MGSPDPITGIHNHHLILFDGVCNLCNGAVRFIIKRDRVNKFRFASLQSAIGQEYLKRFELKPTELFSVLLIKNGQLYDQSDAALEIAKDLSGIWPALNVFRIIPAFVRNVVYKLIAKNRYRLFGKKDKCMIPTPELRARFLQ